MLMILLDWVCIWCKICKCWGIFDVLICFIVREVKVEVYWMVVIMFVCCVSVVVKVLLKVLLVLVVFFIMVFYVGIYNVWVCL